MTWKRERKFQRQVGESTVNSSFPFLETSPWFLFFCLFIYFLSFNQYVLRMSMCQDFAKHFVGRHRDSVTPAGVVSQLGKKDM